MSFVRKLLYFFNDFTIFKFNLFKILTEYRFINTNQYKSFDKNFKIQRNRLYKLVRFATNNVPYYKNLIKEEKIKISESSIFEDLQKFPILTKESIRENWSLLQSNIYDSKFRITTSGGTTGEPISILQGRKFILKAYASTLAFDKIAGFFPGKKVIRLWGNEKEIFQHTSSLYQKIINRFFKNTHFQNSFKMSKKTTLKYIWQINKFKPSIIIAYVQSIYEIAKVIKRNQIKVYSPSSIITSAGVLTSKVKKFLESIFNCKVYNRYGSREVGLIGMSCEESNKLHINMYHQFLEIVDNHGKRMKENQKGNILITNLNNYAMPLIRYKIGDRGSLNKQVCECGRGLYRLNNIHGRIVDTFKNSSGDLIDGEYFTHLFYFMENLKKFQVIQEEVNLIKVLIVTLNGQSLKESTEEEIKEKIKLVMGENCIIKMNYVKEIKPPSSGKFRYTISKI